MPPAELATAVRVLLAAGLCALPARRREKRPAIGAWKPYQARRPTEPELAEWEKLGADGVCLLGGAVSGNLEIIDFDAHGELFPAWRAKIGPALLARLVTEQTPSGGCHVFYRCEAPVCGNLKLAQRKEGDKTLTLIETRGEGGLCLCAPTAGYTVTQGELAKVPTLRADERDALLMAAWELSEYLPPPEPETRPRGQRDAPAGLVVPSGERPGDDFSRRGDVRALLERHGWTLARGGENEYWRRPGKTHGWSATLKDRVFYVFSANAAPFEPGRAYSPFSVLARLEHGGDYEAAARKLRAEGYGGEPAGGKVDLAGLLAGEPPGPADPGPLPEELLRIPGFVSAVMDHSLAIAPYPNVAMAFCGALALQAFLAGRKVRDAANNRTNLYLLGLANSAAGKDAPRKVNTRVLHAVGLAHCLGERFASGEGVQDALFLTPAMLFQTDEIDGLLQSINRSKDARHEALMSTMLTMYSSSSSVYPMRRKAAQGKAPKEPPGVIDQPNLVIFGTAIPSHYYQALSERMLTNGFFARMLIVESGPRSKGQDVADCDPPAGILEAARGWADFQPGGNLETWHPDPALVPMTDAARLRLDELRAEADREYALVEAGGDAVGMTVWGRVVEQVRKLALVYAVSERRENPQIGRDGVQWASRFVLHQTRRMLFMAAEHVADTEFEALYLRTIRVMRQLPPRGIGHHELHRKIKGTCREFSDLMLAMEDRGDVTSQADSTSGRPRTIYWLTRQGAQK